MNVKAWTGFMAVVAVSAAAGWFGHQAFYGQTSVPAGSAAIFSLDEVRQLADVLAYPAKSGDATSLRAICLATGGGTSGDQECASLPDGDGK